MIKLQALEARIFLIKETGPLWGRKTEVYVFIPPASWVKTDFKERPQPSTADITE